MLILVQSNTHIVSDLILMLHSSRARVTQGKIRGPDIIERLAPLKLLVALVLVVLVLLVALVLVVLVLLSALVLVVLLHAPLKLLTQCHPNVC